jgi:hypothetical protein
MAIKYKYFFSNNC